MSEETGQTAEEKKGREAAEEASALDKLTDRVEEKELDVGQTNKAVSNIVSAIKKQNDQNSSQPAKAVVKIKQADVDILVQEFEMSKKSAEKRLREHQGSLGPAIESFL